MTAVVALVCLALGVWQLERLEWKTQPDRRAPGGGACSAGSAAEDPRGGAPSRISPRHRRGRVPQRQGDISRRRRSGRRQSRASGPDAAAAERRPHPLCQSRLCSLRAERPRKARRRPACRTRAGHRSAAAAARQAGLARAGQPPRPELLVLGRSAGDGGGDRPVRCRAVLYRRRCDPEPGRLAERRRDPIDLPNDHLQYAITWFALAAAAVAVYIVWRRQAGTPQAGTQRRG